MSTWHFLENQFLVQTQKSFKKALILSNYHDAALKKAMDDIPGDPDWATLYNRYHPLHLDYVNAYNNWKSAGGAQEGETLNVDQLLALMTANITVWDEQISAVYSSTTPRYKAIFPDGRKPFQTGSKDTRITAVLTLSTNIGADAALALVKGKVDTYYTSLNTARTTQEGAKTGTKAGSTMVDQNRITAMQMQYADLGFLMNKLSTDTETIKIFFDVETLTDPAQTIWKGHLDPSENHPTLVHTFIATDEMRVKSTGNADITVYLATTAGGTDSTPIVITAKHEQTFQASAFGITDYTTHRYLTIVNNSNTTETRFLLELY